MGHRARPRRGTGSPIRPNTESQDGSVRLSIIFLPPYQVPAGGWISPGSGGSRIPVRERDFPVFGFLNQIS
jgi:hypothetical protein